MNVVFRVDASIDMGTGHVMRCLSLAHGLRRLGARCTFVCREHPGNLLANIAKQGFPVHSLPKPRDNTGTSGHEAWLGSTWAEDARETMGCLGNDVVDWLVVDHYALDRRWELEVAPRCRQILAIDDLADRPHACAALLDQNLGRTAADYATLVPSSCKVVAGPHYALLRDEFAELRSKSLTRRIQPELKQLLVTLGGVDKDNVTCKVLRALGAFVRPELRIKVVMGPTAPWLETVRSHASGMACDVEVLVSVANMAILMAESDLAIGAAGSTSWERCVLGMPSFILTLAENQRQIARSLVAAGAARSVTPDEFSREWVQFLGDDCMSEVLAAMSGAAAAITDGRGVERVSAILLEGRAR